MPPGGADAVRRRYAASARARQQQSLALRRAYMEGDYGSERPGLLDLARESYRTFDRTNVLNMLQDPERQDTGMAILEMAAPIGPFRGGGYYMKGGMMRMGPGKWPNLSKVPREQRPAMLKGLKGARRDKARAAMTERDIARLEQLPVQQPSIETLTRNAIKEYELRKIEQMRLASAQARYDQALAGQKDLDSVFMPWSTRTEGPPIDAPGRAQVENVYRGVGPINPFTPDLPIFAKSARELVSRALWGSSVRKTDRLGQSPLDDYGLLRDAAKELQAARNVYRRQPGFHLSQKMGTLDPAYEQIVGGINERLRLLYQALLEMRQHP